MQDLPRLEAELVSPALAGGFFTVSSGESWENFLMVIVQRLHLVEHVAAGSWSQQMQGQVCVSFGDSDPGMQGNCCFRSCLQSSVQTWGARVSSLSPELTCQSCNNILCVAVHSNFRMFNIWGKFFLSFAFFK